MESDETEKTLSEVGREFGTVSQFWRTLSLSHSVLQPCWRAFEELLDSGEIPKRTKQMIAYESAVADGCPKCSAGFRTLLRTVGVDEETIDKLGRDIRSSGLDEESKNLLVYSYYAAKDPHGLDDKLVYSIRQLVGQNKLVEAGAWVNECKMLFDTAHSLKMHLLE